MAKNPPPTVIEKLNLHPRNRHRGRYDFPKLAEALATLKPFLKSNPYDASEITIDFADASAVKTLNAALLKQFYGVAAWDIPANYLCPPIPGRADYLHHVADLLTTGHGGVIPRGKTTRILDIGVGANCIYPLIGQHEYGWRFVGTDVDPVAVKAAQEIVSANSLQNVIEVRLQLSSPESAPDIFRGVLRSEDDDFFDAVICNPPFHSSAYQAREGALRKWKNLRKDEEAGGGSEMPRLNFGGQGGELWCEGGEKGFITQMIEESAERPTQALWFTTLVSKEENLPAIYAALKEAKAAKVETINMGQGQKKSRIVAWRFMKIKKQ